MAGPVGRVCVPSRHGLETSLDEFSPETSVLLRYPAMLSSRRTHNVTSEHRQCPFGAGGALRAGPAPLLRAPHD